MEQNNNFMEDDNGTVLEEKKRWGFFGLPFTFTKYTIKENVVTIDSGFFTKVQDDCYMYKIQDVKLRKTLTQRWFKLGDVVCYTGDTTHHELVLKNIRNSDEIKDFILKYSEQQRIKRRTINTLNIDAAIDDITDI